jgi:hypothetical protein
MASTGAAETCPPFFGSYREEMVPPVPTTHTVWLGSFGELMPPKTRSNGYADVLAATLMPVFSLGGCAQLR